MKYENLGYTATIVNMFSILPLVFNAAVKKSTHTINYLYIYSAIFAQVLWFIYAKINDDKPLLFLATYLIIVFVVMGISKWHYERTGQDVHSQLKNKC